MKLVPYVWDSRIRPFHDAHCANYAYVRTNSKSAGKGVFSAKKSQLSDSKKAAYSANTNSGSRICIVCIFVGEKTRDVGTDRPVAEP